MQYESTRGPTRAAQQKLVFMSATLVSAVRTHICIVYRSDFNYIIHSTIYTLDPTRNTSVYPSSTSLFCRVAAPMHPEPRTKSQSPRNPIELYYIFVEKDKDSKECYVGYMSTRCFRTHYAPTPMAAPALPRPSSVLAASCLLASSIASLAFLAFAPRG